MIILGVHLTIILKFIVTLLTIINPFSISGIYLNAVDSLNRKEKNVFALTVAIAVFIILTIVAWVGISVLNAFGININAFKFGGGIVVLFFGLRVIGVIPQVQNTSVHTDSKKLAIVPMAMPLVAGPGTLVATISEVHVYFATVEAKIIATACIVFVALLLWLFFRELPKILEVLGNNIMDIISKIMGLFLTALAVEMMFDGIKGFFF
ncbi:MarC family protein [Francisella adeliensis]|uniref:MarC family protein n=1 Tax=Francisella adeliensis TaxID=2007306 RepID=UPI00201B5022|nr:MarC family protein [Francisella adeliensis]